MFCTPTETIRARKQHQCTWCGQPIAKGETHQMWKSVDGGWFTNRMHPECADACAEECREWNDDEYHPFDNERPAYSKESESDSKKTNGLATEAANPLISNENLAEWTGLEPATPGVTGRCANRATTGGKP